MMRFGSFWVFRQRKEITRMRIKGIARPLCLLGLLFIVFRLSAQAAVVEEMNRRISHSMVQELLHSATSPALKQKIIRSALEYNPRKQ